MFLRNSILTEPKNKSLQTASARSFIWLNDAGRSFKITNSLSADHTLLHNIKNITHMYFILKINKMFYK